MDDKSERSDASLRKAININGNDVAVPTMAILAAVDVTVTEAIAYFLQTHARKIGLGQIRGHPEYVHTLYSPTLLNSSQKQASHMRDDTPHNSITVHLQAWTSEEKATWDEKSVSSRLATIYGHSNHSPESAELLTVQLIVAKHRDNLRESYVLTFPNHVRSSVVLCYDIENKRPLLCGWTEDFRCILSTAPKPRVRVPLDQTKAAAGNYYYTPAKFPESGPVVPIRMNEEDRNARYTPEQRKFFQECQVSCWGTLAEKIFQMAEDTVRLDRTMLSRDFNDLWEME